MSLKVIAASLNNIADELNDISNENEKSTAYNIIDVINDINNNSGIFGKIAINARKDGNFIRLNLEENGFGTDFSDDEDLRQYVKNEHEAMDYATNVLKPNIEATFSEYKVILPSQRNLSIWYDDPRYN